MSFTALLNLKFNVAYDSWDTCKARNTKMVSQVTVFVKKSPKILTTLASTIFSPSQIATNTSTLLPSSKGASEENEADYNRRIVTRNAEGI